MCFEEIDCFIFISSKGWITYICLYVCVCGAHLFQAVNETYGGCNMISGFIYTKCSFITVFSIKKVSYLGQYGTYHYFLLL